MTEQKDKGQLAYAQQHLANERTYLAWVRTAIAIIGIGLLILHFFVGNLIYPFANFLITVLGISAGMFGVSIIIIATSSYVKKKKQIENHTFYSSQTPVLFVSYSLTTISLVAIIYFAVSQYFVS